MIQFPDRGIIDGEMSPINNVMIGSSTYPSTTHLTDTWRALRQSRKLDSDGFSIEIEKNAPVITAGAVNVNVYGRKARNNVNSALNMTNSAHTFLHHRLDDGGLASL